VAAGLPAGLGAQLGSAISALGSGGPFPIKLPSVATDTSNRTGLVAQISSVLGNSKIPAPNFNMNADTTNAHLKKQNDLHAQQEDLLKQMDEQSMVIDKARDAFVAARDTFPAGDPAIASAKAVYVAEVDKLAAINAKLTAVDNQA
jgi:hypothetical protein